MKWSYLLSELAGVIGAAPPARDARFSSVSTDTRTLKPGDLFFALKGPNFDADAFAPEAFRKGACAAVTGRAVDDGPCLVVGDALAALQTFAARHRTRYSGPLFALTGSCGKTTTKELTAAVLATRYRVVKTHGNLNNEIGCPLSLLSIDEDTQHVVIEMGANHAGEIARICSYARPTETAITLIAPAHLEGFGSVENVAMAKAEIVDALAEDGVFYVNADDPWCVRIAERFPGEKVTFGRTGNIVLETCAPDDSGEILLRVNPVGELRLPLPSRAYAANVLLAIAVGLRHGVSEFEEPLRRACVEGARVKIRRVGPLEVIDDTYNANPGSMAAALETLAGRPGAGARMAALGDMLELGEQADHYHRELGTKAGELGVARLFVRGDHAAAVVEGARAAGVADARVYDTHEAIAEAVLRAARPNDVLLVKGSRGMRMERVIEALTAMTDKDAPAR